MMHGYKKTTTAPSTFCEVGNLYGSPTAGRNWYKTLVKWLLDYGFEQCDSDLCYFKLLRNGKCLHMIVWVDDIISFCDSDDLYNEFAAAFFGQVQGHRLRHRVARVELDEDRPDAGRSQHFDVPLHQG
eukprot:2247504-Prymnesium_polylepis.1